MIQQSLIRNLFKELQRRPCAMRISYHKHNYLLVSVNSNYMATCFDQNFWSSSGHEITHTTTAADDDDDFCLMCWPEGDKNFGRKI
jgi:elongation factor P hydroxylase